MARVEPFEAHTERYETWFARGDAAFCPASGVQRLVTGAGFSALSWALKPSRSPEESVRVEPVRPGRGQRAFVVVHAANDEPSR